MNHLALLVLVLVSQILSYSGPLSNIYGIHVLGHVSEDAEGAFVRNKIGSGGRGVGVGFMYAYVH